MSRDLLAEATRALREDTDASPAHPDATRARVMVTLRKESNERARRISLIRVAIPIAAVLAGSMAWAAAGGHLPTSLRAVFPQPQTPSMPEAPPSPRLLPSPAPSPAPRDIESPRVEEPVSAPLTTPPPAAPTPAFTAPPQPRAARKDPSILAPPAQIPAAPVEAAPPPVAPAEPDEQALYAAAHRLHFVEHNPGAALAAWDTYLRAAPRGRLSVEAHYNRALCLVRLGRAAEAESSLQSFARGSYGGYRQAEARALLEALHGAQP